MDTGRKASGSSSFFANPLNISVSTRDLSKSHLGGVIFGCKKTTIKECLSKQLFGLPGHHFSYVKNIDPGLPLFLFNYSDRNLHGIFEAASPGQMNINPYGWTTNGAVRTLYPAQVQICVRLHCQPLSEEQFRPIIADNYYNPNHFWFELDHAQTSKLMSILSSQAVAPSASARQSSTAWKTLFPSFTQCNMEDKGKDSNSSSKIDCVHSDWSNRKLSSIDDAPCPNESKSYLECPQHKQVVENDEKGLMLKKLEELVLHRESENLASSSNIEDSAVLNDSVLDDKGFVKGQTILEDRNKDSLIASSDPHPVIAQLIREELKVFKAAHAQRMSYMEQRLADAEIEIQQLKEHCMMLESICRPSGSLVDQTMNQAADEKDMDPDGLIFIVGGCDGETWSSTLDCYSPSQDMKKSLVPLTIPRSYASVAMLNGKLYIFGGGDGSEWYDSVEAYNLDSKEWTLCSPLNKEKGSLAGATLNGKIFALGGGNGIECFSDVEMFDLDVGHWIPARSMLQKVCLLFKIVYDFANWYTCKGLRCALDHFEDHLLLSQLRFALGGAELNGVLYAVGGYDGNDYLKSVERFDPREHSWTKVGGMKTKRGSHSVVVLNEKLYAMGGFDGDTMVASVEIYDPRLDSWMDGDSMNQARGYSAAAAVDKSIYVIGGVEDGENIVGTVELYEEGLGWRVIKQTALGKRCFASAIVP